MSFRMMLELCFFFFFKDRICDFWQTLNFSRHHQTRRAEQVGESLVLSTLHTHTYTVKAHASGAGVLCCDF